MIATNWEQKKMPSVAPVMSREDKARLYQRISACPSNATCTENACGSQSHTTCQQEMHTQLDFADYVQSPLLFVIGLSGTLPSSWSNMSQLQNLSLSGNNLDGTLPPSWGNFSQLQTLDLYGNRLCGTMPTSWQDLSQLHQLKLSNNSLTGTLPEAIVAMTQLTTLCLDTNNLSSTLPGSWQALTQLTQLHLEYNQLSGSLPESWSAMDQIKFMTLSMNNISGPLPCNWTAMATNELHSLHLGLGGNYLTGVVPASWGHISYLSISGSFSVDGSLHDLPNIDLTGEETDVELDALGILVSSGV